MRKAGAIAKTERSIKKNERPATGILVTKKGEHNIDESPVTKKSKKDGTLTTLAQDAITVKDHGWNDMLHLSIKRFNDNDPILKPGAIRNRLQYPYVAIAEYDKSGCAICKSCGIAIQPKGTLRITLMMECNKGYRNPCTLHESCFWKHREVSKLISASEVFIHPSILKDDPAFEDIFAEQFNNMTK